MKTEKMRTLSCSNKGFTLIEVLTVLGILAAIVAIAVPPYVQWRQNVQYRSAARAIAAVLRDARSRTISGNIQHRIEFEMGGPTPTGRYRMTQGNRAANSDTWNTIVLDWAPVPTGVTLNLLNLTVNAGSDSIDFNPNGAANFILGSTTAEIQIRDSTGATRFTVEVSNTGRIRIL